MRRLGFALLVVLLFQGQTGAQEVEGGEAAENSEEGEAPPPAEKPPEAQPAPTARTAKASRAKKPPPKPKVGKDGLHWSRKPRKGAKLLGAVVPEERLRTAPPPRPSGNL